MASTPHRVLGFTLIELMVTVAVFVVLALLAVPSFSAFRQRSALRGAAEQTTSFWNQARFEAAKRNRLVKVGVAGSAGNFCLGAATTTTIADTVPCDCTSAGACDVGAFPTPSVPVDISQWNGVSLASVTYGGGNSVAVIEPKRTELTVAANAGAISLAGPPGRNQYRLNVLIDRFGRASICESTSANQHMSDFEKRQCGP